MAQVPQLKRLAREDFKEAPEWFARFLDLLSPFLGDVAGALGGQLDASNLRKQLEPLTLTTGATLEATFATATVGFKNRLGVPPRKVSLAKCNPVPMPSFGQESWVTVGAAGAPAFETGWASYSTVDGSFVAPSFRIDGNGWVHLRGLARSGTVGGAGVIFTLPAGYRPAKNRTYAVSAVDAFGSGRVQANGQVLAVVGANAWWQLDGIGFEAAPGTWTGIGPFGPPVWDLNSAGQIRIRYIAGLSPATKYELTFEVE